MATVNSTRPATFTITVSFDGNKINRSAVGDLAAGSAELVASSLVQLAQAIRAEARAAIMEQAYCTEE